MLVSSCTLSDLGSQPVMDTLPGSIIPKLLKVGIDALPFGRVRWNHAPLASSDREIQDRIDHRSHTQRPGTPSRLCRRDQVFDTIPLNVSQISWVDVVVFHLHSLSHLNDWLFAF